MAKGQGRWLRIDLKIRHVLAGHADDDFSKVV